MARPLRIRFENAYYHVTCGGSPSSFGITLSLGTVMIGALEDQQVKEVLGIREEPLYIVPVGKV